MELSNQVDNHFKNNYNEIIKNDGNYALSTSLRRV